MLLGWRDVVEGIFEMVRRDGDVLIVTNLVDELTYQVRSNMGGHVFRALRPLSYVLARFVPMGSEWLVSGVMHPIDKGRRKIAYALAAELATKCPRLLFRNPYYLERGWELQRQDRDRFVRFFGSDMVVVPGTEIAERMAVPGLQPQGAPGRVGGAARDRWVQEPPPSRVRFSARTGGVRTGRDDL